MALTISQARQQLQAQRRAVQSQREQIEAQRVGRTQTQLRRANLSQQTKFRDIEKPRLEKELEIKKAKQRQKLKEFEKKVLAPFESKIVQAETKLRELREARARAKKKSKDKKKQQQKTYSDLEKQGLISIKDPVSGNVVGFTDPETRATINVSQIGKGGIASLNRARELKNERISSPSVSVEAPQFEAPPSVVDVPPSRLQLLRESIKSDGKIRGTLSFIGEELGRTERNIDLYFQKNVYGIENPRVYRGEQTAKLVKFGFESGVYISPVGGAVLFGQGAEELGTKAGRERIKAREESLVGTELFGVEVDPVSAKVLAYGQPVSEVALGGLGLKSQYSSFKTNKIISPPSQARVQTTEWTGRGLTYQNIPKGKVTTLDGKSGAVEPIKGGVLVTEKPVGSIQKTTITSLKGDTPYQSIEYVGADGRSVGKIDSMFWGKKYTTKFTRSPEGEVEFNIFSKGKLSKNVKTEVEPNQLFGLGEPSTPKGSKKEVTYISPDKSTIRAIDEVQTTSQNLIRIEKSSPQIKGSQKTQTTTSQLDVVTPAEAKNVIDAKKFSGDDIKMVLTTDKKPAKFSNQNPPDFKKVEGVVLLDEGIAVGSTEKITPKFNTFVQESRVSKGDFVFDSRSKFRRTLEERPLGIPISSKRGELKIGVREPELLSDFETAVSIPSPAVSSSSSNLQVFRPSLKTQTSQIGTLALLEKLDLKTQPQSKSQIKTDTQTKMLEKIAQPQRDRIRTRTKTRTKQAERVKTLTRTLQQQLPRLRRITKSPSRSVPRTTPRVRRPTKPRKLIFPKLSPSGSSSGKKVKSKSKSKIKVFGRRFGEDLLLGEFAEKRKAEKELSKFLTGTLGRSGFLKSGGKRIKSDLLKDPSFRSAKKESKRVVQRRRFSLGTSSERTEIKRARKKKGKSKKKKR